MKCPKCDKLMEEVEFSDGTVKPDGIPGVICHDCDIKITGDDIADELYNRYDNWKDGEDYFDDIMEDEE